MKVLIDAVGIRGHGGAAVLQELLYWLPKTKPDWDWQVFLLPDKHREFDLHPKIDSVDIKYSSVGNTPVGRLFWIYFILPKMVRAYNPDVVFSLTNIGRKSFKQPLIVFLHRPQILFEDFQTTKNFYKRIKTPILRYFTLKGIKESQYTIVQTEAMKSKLNRNWKFDGKIKVIPSGYHTLYDKNSVSKEVKELIEYSGTYPKLIYVSYPSEHKNHEILIRALPALIQKYPNIRLYLTISESNPGNNRFQKFADHLIDLSKKLNVYDHIAWMGQLSSAEVMYAFEQVDLHVFPSLMESFGLGIVEAMAMKCPVLIADRAYAHDVAGDAGWYFDPKSINELSSKINEIIENKQEVGEKINRGIKNIEKYSYENISFEITKVLSI